MMQFVGKREMPGIRGVRAAMCHLPPYSSVLCVLVCS
jgi:hypothetical protein